MNKISPKALINSKWTKVDIVNKEKHFIVIELIIDDEQRVTNCVIQAVMTNNEYQIDWRALKDSKQWRLGWQ